jgi:dienelactone hydrolase
MHPAVRATLLIALASGLVDAPLGAQGVAKGTKPITPADLKAWNSIRQTAFSSNGKWFAYVIAPVEGDATVIYRGTAKGATETRVPVGNGGGSVAISGDSRWLGYVVAPPRPPTGGGRGGRGAGGGSGNGRGGAPADTAARAGSYKFVLVNLATGEKKEFDKIRRFAFNTDTATWIVMQGGADVGGGAPGAGGAGGGRGAAPGAGAPAGGAGGGADLLLYNIASGETFNMGRVDAYSFSRGGDWLAYTMSTSDRVGNGVQLGNMKTGSARSLENAPLLYTHLAWVDSSAALSVMRGRVDSIARDTVFSIELFSSFGPDGPAKKVVFDPSGRKDFPVGWKLASERAPRYADDMTAVFVGIREGTKPAPRGVAANGRGASPITAGAPGAGGTGAIPPGGRGAAAPATGGAADSLPSLILWHYKDTRLQSQQIVQEQADRSFNFLAEYRLGDDRFVRLADDSIRNVTITTGDDYAYGVDTRAYDERASYTGRNYQDVYSIDLKTGARKLLQRKKPTGPMTSSPDGRKVLFWGKDANYWVLDLVTGDSTNITKGVPTSFANSEDDHNNLYPPPIQPRGWTSDGAAVVLYDNWDLWKVPVNPGGGPAVNLTGDGKRTQVHYQTMYRFASTPAAGRGGAGAPGGGGRGGAATGIDLTQPLYIGTYGEWTKKEGLSRVDPGQPGAKSLFFDDAKYNITKARDADAFIYTRQTFTDYPNYFAFGPGFKDGYQLTDANPQQKDLAWSSGTRLVNYTTAKGDKLQGALYLPADYQPGKPYPMLVTIYEKRSQGKNVFVSPSDTRAPDPTLYTSRGYVVFDPDIVYKVNDPGMSAVWALIPAVKAAIATGMVDPRHVGLWGHSWGGYQTAFMVTQTDIFAAAVAGAPLTNMVSMYASVYWNSGGSDAAIFESSQGRFKGNFIENYDAYIRNSPVFHANKVHTPLMILQNDKDGAVDFNQGVTYYNTLRQLGKEVVFLEYVGENHGLARPVNQRDYATRMAEYFDHYLKGAPAPDWLKDGIPRLKMEEHLISRRDTTTPPPASGTGAGGGGNRR